MELNLAHFLTSLSTILDYIEMDILGDPTYHTQRVAYMAYRFAKPYGLCDEELFDLISLAILHDNGATEGYLLMTTDQKGFKDHCILGENNIKEFPFINKYENIILYHHERYDGEGVFGIQGDNIPLFSQLIFLSNLVDIQLGIYGYEKFEKIREAILSNRGTFFSEKVAEVFDRVTKNIEFWLDLKNEFITSRLLEVIPKIEREVSWGELKRMTRIFSNIVDAKSKFTKRHSNELAEKVDIMSDYYGVDDTTKIKMHIAADLHDIGKLAVSNTILDKDGKLNEDEMNIIKKHVYLTRESLKKITGFEDITEWAANHHEKLNGSGYPYGFKKDRLDFNSRLFGCLDIYQALTEERPYRAPMSHEKGMEILYAMSSSGLIDENIVKDIEVVFGNKSNTSIL